MAEPTTQTLEPAKGLMESLDAIHKEAFPVIADLPPKPEGKSDPDPKVDDGLDEPEELPDAPETAKPSQALDWQKAKEARKTARQKYETRIKALTTELEKLKTSPTVDHSEVETLRKSKSDLEKELQSVAIERSPEFQNRFKIEAETIIEVAKQNVSPAHAGKLEAILSLPPGRARTGELDAFVADLSPSEVALVNSAVLDMDKLNHKKRVIVDRQRDQWLKDQDQRNAAAKAQAAEQQKKFSNQFDETIKSAKETFPIYVPKENDPKWNERVEKQVKLAEQIFRGDGMEPRDLAKAALWAAAAPSILEDYSSLLADNQRLSKELQGIRGSTPSPNGGGSPAKDLPDDKNLSGVDYIIKQVERAGLIR